EMLRDELRYLIDNNITQGGEYQLTHALENMRRKGLRFVPGEVSEWMDCGNKDVTVDTNSRMLGFLQDREEFVDTTAKLENAKVIPPCHSGPNVTLRNAEIGRGVSIGSGTTSEDSKISHSIIQSESNWRNVHLVNSLLANKAELGVEFRSVSH